MCKSSEQTFKFIWVRRNLNLNDVCASYSLEIKKLLSHIALDTGKNN